MAEQKTESSAAEMSVEKNAAVVEPSAGTAGLNTQLNGQATTVSGVAEATGGVENGNYIEPDMDDELFKFKGVDSPLMDMMLKAKKRNVKSAVVDHPMVDEERPTVTTASALTIEGTDTETGTLVLVAKDKRMLRPWDTIIARGIDGYEADGSTKTPGRPLMLMVEAMASNGPVVRAVNGVKTSSDLEFSCLVTIPAGTVFTVLSNAMYETQKHVEPSSIVPVKRRINLQKRGMNTVVSDYFDSQKKGIDFQKAAMAEMEIKNFKQKGNRTLWAGIPSSFMVRTKLGMQRVYTTEGIRYQFMRELQHRGKWTFEEFVALAKMYYTGVDVPKTGIVLCGKNFLEGIQCIDFSKHPEIKIDVVTNKLGWTVTQIHTVFGDFQLKRDPTLDDLGWSNSAAIIGEDRCVHYVRTAEHSFTEKVEGEEATRSGEIAWDAFALKGACHIWIDGEEEGSVSTNAVNYVYHDSAEAPKSPVKNMVYYLLQDCPGIKKDALQGQMWKYTGTAWEEFSGDIFTQSK